MLSKLYSGYVAQVVLDDSDRNISATVRLSSRIYEIAIFERADAWKLLEAEAAINLDTC